MKVGSETTFAARSNSSRRSTQKSSLTLLSYRPLDHDVLDLPDRRRRIQALWADVHAIHDRVTAKQPVRIVEVIEPLVQCLVAAVGDEAVRREQSRRAHELIR